MKVSYLASGLPFLRPNAMYRPKLPKRELDKPNLTLSADRFVMLKARDINHVAPLAQSGQQFLGTWVHLSIHAWLHAYIYTRIGIDHTREDNAGTSVRTWLLWLLVALWMSYNNDEPTSCE